MPEQSDVYRELLDNLGDGVYFTDLECRITYWNKGAERLSGFTRAEVLGKRCRESLLMHLDGQGRELCTTECPLRSAIDQGRPHESEVFLHHKEGARIPVRVCAVPIRDASGKIRGAAEVFSDNTSKAQMAEKLAQMEALALLDTLTTLPNRRYLQSQVLSCLGELRRNGWGFGILFMDIDNFKRVNDTWGHDAGDRVLRMVARTLDANSRSFDVVGRWGGEEFLAIIHNTDEGGLREIGERFCMLVERSVLTDLDSLCVTLSIGSAMASAEDTFEALMRRADESLYQAKRSGRNQFRFGA